MDFEGWGMRVAVTPREYSTQEIAALSLRKPRGVRRVSLETATDNEAGVAFWQRHGYRTSGVMRRYYLGRTDAFTMIKTLRATAERPGA